MPKSIRKPKSEIRCTHCEKLLATCEGIKCPRCKQIHTPEERFAEELCPDQYLVTFLWTPDGSQASSITIRKEVWINMGHRSGVPKDRLQYLVFFVYNGLDPSKACSSDAGCRVNKEPILNFTEALQLAKSHEAEARKSGKWVEVEDIRRPTLQKPNGGVWDFRRLECLSREGVVTFDDLCATLRSESNGAGISPCIVIGIIRKMAITPEQLLQLRELAENGVRNAKGQALDEWQQLLGNL